MEQLPFGEVIIVACRYCLTFVAARVIAGGYFFEAFSRFNRLRAHRECYCPLCTTPNQYLNE
jgi:hypothetical protein